MARRFSSAGCPVALLLSMTIHAHSAELVHLYAAGSLRSGAQAVLAAKALQLMGGPSSPPAPANRVIYGALVADGQADIFLAYCTGARAAQRENPGQQIVQLPDALAVGADYGLTVMSSAPPAAYRFAMFILADGQRILADYGFAAPNLPAASIP